MLSRKRVASLCDFVSWTTNFHNVLSHLHLQSWRKHAISILPFFLLTCGTSSEIRLMLATLSMREVRAIVLVDCETETTFETADVVLEEVWVLIWMA